MLRILQHCISMSSLCCNVTYYLIIGLILLCSKCFLHMCFPERWGWVWKSRRHRCVCGSGRGDCLRQIHSHSGEAAPVRATLHLDSCTVCPVCRYVLVESTWRTHFSTLFLRRGSLAMSWRTPSWCSVTPKSSSWPARRRWISSSRWQ